MYGEHVNGYFNVWEHVNGYFNVWEHVNGCVLLVYGNM